MLTVRLSHKPKQPCMTTLRNALARSEAPADTLHPMLHTTASYVRAINCTVVVSAAL